MECQECLNEMEGLGQLIKMGAGAIEVLKFMDYCIWPIIVFVKDFLIENYCPTVTPDPNGQIQCERDLAGNYVTLLEMIVEHFFVEGAEHICKAWGVCPVAENKLTKYRE